MVNCVGHEDLDIIPTFNLLGDSQVALVVQNPPANAKDVRDLGSIPGS